MGAAEQKADPQRYQVIPRTLIFLQKGDSFLLLKGAPDKKRFANLYNGVGGHVERGEDALTAARRELQEETGLEADLWLCGVVTIDTGAQPGICLFVFGGRQTGGELRPSREGTAMWIPFAQIPGLPALPDLLPLLTRIRAMRRGATPFFAQSFYDAADRLQIRFADLQR